MASFSAERLRAYKLDSIREHHENKALATFKKFAAAPEEDIDRRIAELNLEWDIEHALQANSAVFSLAGLALAVTRGRKWIILPAMIAASMLHHAAQGWSAPHALMRKLGFRSAREIEEERYALRLIKRERFGREIGPSGLPAAH